MKEVKLKINLDGILQECLSMNEKDANMHSRVSSKVGYLDALKNIFSRNLEIENDPHTDGGESGSPTKKERELILRIIKNNMFQYIVYSGYFDYIILKLHSSLRAGAKEDIRYYVVSLLNELVKPNPLIYIPEHGMHIQHNMNEVLKNINIYDKDSTLGTRTCTVQIDDTNPLGLEKVLQLTTESLEREFYYYISHAMCSMSIDILKKYSVLEECYSLDELYTTTTHKDSGVALVDYGLMLVYEKHYEMGKLIKLVKAMEENFEDPVDIVKEIKKVLTFDDLQIVVSISNNLAKIRYEKGISKHMIKAIEYMAENTSFLKGKNETMALEIDKSLNGFYESYITNGCLENTIYRRKNEITEEIAGDSELLSKECEKYNKKRLQKLIEISGARFENDELDESRAITYLKNKIDALEWKLKKEDLQSKKTHELLYTERFLSEISPAQKNYMFRKMEEFANARKIKVLEARKPFLAELLSTSSRLQKLILILSIIFFIFGFVLFIEIYKKKIEITIHG